MTQDMTSDAAFRQRHPVMATMFCALFMITCFFMSVSFRGRDYGSTGVDFQVLLRLGILIVDLGVCLVFYKLWIRGFVRPDNIPLVILTAMFLVSSFYAPNFASSFGCSLSVLVYFLLAFTCKPILGMRGTLLSLLAVLTIIQVLSLGAYVLFPQIGHAKIWVGGHQVPSHRLGGIVGANATGAGAALALLLIYFLRTSFDGLKSSPSIFWFCLIINFAALALSMSRTAMASLILSLAFASTVRRPSALRLAMLFGILAALVFFLATVDTDWLLTHLSRSGNSEEITTGTGRIFIWRKALELIAQKPFSGWGYAASAFILPQFKELGDVAPHCHNLYLQLAFSVGWGGTIFYVLFFLTKTAQSFVSRDIFRMTLLMMALVGSFTEVGPFAGLANTETLLIGFIAANEWNSRKARTTRAEPDYSQAAVSPA